MKVLILASLLVLSTAQAHDDHDWRLDYEAFINVSHEILPMKSIRTQEAPARVDMKFFKEKLEVLASTERKSTEGLNIARNFLAEEYKKLGFEVSLHPFGTGTNFIAEKKGTVTPEKVLIISSHIDSVGNKGANDNGTGTIGVLAVAKELAKNEFKSTIRILGFDREEVGLKGSDAYVATIEDKKSVIGNINFEMMGFHSKNDGSFHVIDCQSTWSTNSTVVASRVISTQIMKSVESLGLGLKNVKTCTDRSDHASFWRHKIPAVVISENFFGGDGDPCYHSKCDVFDERLNYVYMGKILEAVLDTTEQLSR